MIGILCRRWGGARIGAGWRCWWCVRGSVGRCSSTLRRCCRSGRGWSQVGRRRLRQAATTARWCIFGSLPTAAGIAVRMAGVGVVKPSTAAAPAPAAGPSSKVVVPQRTAPTAAGPSGTSPLTTTPAAAPATTRAATASTPVHVVLFVTAVAIRDGSTSRGLPTTWPTGVVGSHHGGRDRHAGDVLLPVHGAGRRDPAPRHGHIRLLRPSHRGAHARRSRGVVRTRGRHPVRHGRHLRRWRWLERHRRTRRCRWRVRRTLRPGTGRLRFAVVSVVFGGCHGGCGPARGRARWLRAGGCCGGWRGWWNRWRRTLLGHWLWHHRHGLLHARVRIPHSLVLGSHQSHHTYGK